MRGQTYSIIPLFNALEMFVLKLNHLFFCSFDSRSTKVKYDLFKYDYFKSASGPGGTYPLADLNRGYKSGIGHRDFNSCP